jgi:hypothetical protein
MISGFLNLSLSKIKESFKAIAKDDLYCTNSQKSNKK